MTLLEYLLQHQNDFVYVGSFANFIYIGKADKAIKTLEADGDKFLKSFEKAVQNLDDEKVAIPRRIKANKDTIDLQNDTIRDLYEQLDAAKNQLEKLKEYMPHDPKEKPKRVIMWQYKDVVRQMDDIQKHIVVCYETIKRAEQRINYLHSIAQSWPKRYEKATTRVSKYQKFLDREVTDTYQRTVYGPLGTIIKITGDEVGCFWDYDEYQKGHKDE